MHKILYIKKYFSALIFFSFLFIFSTRLFGQAPDFLWLANAGSPGSTTGEKVAVDNNGNIIVTGYFDSTITFGTLKLSSFGSADIFLAKYDPSGEILWAKQAGGSDYDNGYSVTADKNGNIIITGSFTSASANFDGLTVRSVGGSDVFVAKYDPNGKIIWVKTAGGQMYDVGYGVTADGNNNVIITGTFSSSISFGTISLKGHAYSDIFVAKYDPNGNVLWARGAGNNGFYNSSSGVAVNSNNDVFITGSIGDTVTFDNITIASIGGEDAIIAKYDENGNINWVKQAGGKGSYDYSNDISVDKNDNLYITGQFSGIAFFGNIQLTSVENSDIFIAKYDASGTPVWVSKDSRYSTNTGVGISADDAENVSVIGNLLIGDFDDIYIGRFNKNGVKTWSTIAGGNFNDRAGGVANGLNGDLIVSGSFSDTAAFGSKEMVSVGYSDAFLGRIPAPQLAFSPHTLNFNSVAPGENIIKNILYSNPSKSNLHIYNTNFVDSNKQYTLQGKIADSITAGASASIGIKFSPNILGKLSAELIVESDAPTSPDALFIMSNVVNPTFSFSSDTLNFGNVDINKISAKNLTIKNIGSTNLFINKFTISGNDKNDFSLLNISPPDTILPLISKELLINFKSSTPGLKTAKLILTTNVIGIADTIYLFGTGTLGTINLSSNLVDFGSVDINRDSISTLKITNAGTGSLIISNYSVIGPNSSDFTISYNAVPDTIPPENSININIKFAPKTSGNKNAMLLIISNSTSGSDTVKLSGKGASVISVELPANNIVGQDIDLIINPPQGFNFNNIKLYYRRAGERTYQQTDLTLSNNSYTAVIPASYSTIRGIQYYIVFSEEGYTVTYPLNDPANNPAYIEVSVPEYTYPTVIKKSVYRMISVPLVISNPLIDSVLGNSFGFYDNTKWRILRWDPGANMYTEYPNLNGDLVPGNAFWFIENFSKSFNVKNAVTVSSSGLYSIKLQPGWNQIGDPYAFPVDWDSVLSTSQIQLPIHWNPDIEDYEINQRVLQPWDGYWVFNPDTVFISLNFRPIASNGIPKNNNTLAELKSGEFLIQLKANIEKTNIIDDENYVGMLENAKDGKDKYDVLVPPSITGNLNFNIVSGNTEYAENILASSKDGAYWDIKLTSNLKDKNLIVELYKSSFPANFQIWFLDRDKLLSISINGDKLSIPLPKNGKGSYRLITGNEEYAKEHSENIPLVPLEYSLSQNYPNPFNPSTNIDYQLKELSTVSLEIFNILGQKINVLVDNKLQNPGQYRVSWDGTNQSGSKVSTGIYIYRIRANNFVSSKKMILLK